MRRVFLVFTLLALVVSAGCGGDDKKKPPLFQPKPECMGADVVPLQGDHFLIISSLEIGTKDDGFDLDGDGNPDNKLSAVGSLANPALKESVDMFDVMIPIEFFDYPANQVDECVKFGIYVGQYKLDLDGDGEKTAEERGDCNDHDPNIRRGVDEIVGDGVDNNCNGMADETINVIMTDGGTMQEIIPSDDVSDADGDGVTLADGDCDDTNAMVKPGLDEICSDGLDNDCDGIADHQILPGGAQACTPFDDTPDVIVIDPVSLNPDNSPIIEFNSGATRMDAGKLILEAGPSLFSVEVPITDDISLDVRVSGASIIGDMIAGQNGIEVRNGRLGGVFDANTMDKIRGLEVDEIMLKPEDSLLDAMFANILGTILGLPKNDMGCLMPDIDVDQDGLEAFCDSDPLDEFNVVDMCIDGDGTIVMDGEGGITHCTEARDKDGNLRFRDGISVALKFEAIPAIPPDSL